MVEGKSTGIGNGSNRDFPMRTELVFLIESKLLEKDLQITERGGFPPKYEVNTNTHLLCQR